MFNKHRYYSLWQDVLQLHDEINLALALSVIPEDRLKKEAAENYQNIPESVRHQTSEREELFKGLLTWFKGYFHWMNKPDCPFCQSNQNVVNVGVIQPYLPEHAEGKCSRVETYNCQQHSLALEFPRYNNVLTILQNRTGRCGEWAKAFTLCANALGFKARLTYGMYTDHVWTEVYSDHLKKWVHSDGCENAYNNPLMYESGWGKKFVHVVSYHQDRVVDVTRRYTRDIKQVELRQKSQHLTSDFLKSTLLLINTKAQAHLNAEELSLLKKEEQEEEFDLKNSTQTPKTEDEFNERQSGSREWRSERGEMSHKKKKIDSNSKINLDQWNLYGDAKIEKGGFLLTENQQSKRGGVFLQKLVPSAKFSMTFQFHITPQGADGFAVVILKPQPNITLGGGGNGKGYHTMENAVAIEFDTYSSPANHIAIHIPDNDGILRHGDYPLLRVTSCPVLNNGHTYHVSVRFEKGTLILYMDSKLVFKQPLDIKKVLRTDQVLLGFTAATGGLSQEHFVQIHTISIPSVTKESVSTKELKLLKSNWNQAHQLGNLPLSMEQVDAIIQLKDYDDYFDILRCIFLKQPKFLSFILRDHPNWINDVIHSKAGFIASKGKFLSALSSLYSYISNSQFYYQILVDLFLNIDFSEYPETFLPCLINILHLDLELNLISEKSKFDLCELVHKFHSNGHHELFNPILATILMHEDASGHYNDYMTKQFSEPQKSLIQLITKRN